MLTQRIQYLNFTPTNGFQLYADALVSKLTDLAPSDAWASSSIVKSGGRYACKIEIVSMAAKFNALIEAANPKSALEEARRRIVRQLSKWRKQRFL